jgi:metallophosphoesterase (TIGR00282 family)
MQSKHGKSLRIVFIGDISGKSGRRFLGLALPLIRIKFSPDIVIANGENAAGGLGITQKTAYEIFECGVDVITGGNHIWDKKEALGLLKEEPRIIRPLNFPDGVPGNGSYVFYTADQTPVLVVNAQGRVFMEPVVENPFLKVDALVNQAGQKIILVDFHAEATAEKQALGIHLDGRVSAVLGTHTHVQTADLRILPEGTAYQSDVGMTGAFDSVIGMKPEPVIQRFLTGINQKFEVAKHNVILDMTLIDVDKNNGKALHVEYLKIFESSYEKQLAF